MFNDIYQEEIWSRWDESCERSSVVLLADSFQELSQRKTAVQALSEYAPASVENFERFCFDLFRIPHPVTGDLRPVRLYSKQRRIAKLYLQMPAPYRRMGVRSGHSVGKTTLLALLLEYEFSCLMCSVLTSAPGREAVKNSVWKDILKNRQKATRPLPGDYLLSPELRVDGAAEWWARGMFTNSPERAQGVKHPRLRLMLDEASGLPQWFWDAVDSSMSSNGARMLVTGNPLHAKGRFKSIFTSEKAIWLTITISSLDSPCITRAQAFELWEMIRKLSPELAAEIRHDVEAKEDEPWHDGEDPAITFDGLAAYSWVKEKLVEWGAKGEFDKIRTRILGLFPTDAKNKINTLPTIEAAQRYWLEQEEEESDLAEPPTKIHIASLDCAGDGEDYTALSYIRGNRIHYAWATNEPDTTKQTEMVEDWIGSIATDDKPRQLNVDIAGVGKALFDQLRKSRREKPHIWGRTRIVKWWANWTAETPETYVFLVDELHFRLAKAIHPNTPYAERLGVPPDDRVPYIERRGGSPELPEALSVTGHYNTRDFYEDERERKRISGKKQIEKSGNPSPDLCDSGAGLFYVKRGSAVGVH